MLKEHKCASDTGSGPITDEFRGAQVAVALIAFAILQLVESNALRMHLTNISSLLHSGIKSHQLEPEETPDEKTPDEESIHEEPDDELRAVEPFVHKAGVQSDLVTTFLDWVKLLVTHFDAIRILLRFVNGRYFQGTTISIKLLAIPPIMPQVRPIDGTAPQNLSQMPWEDLFTDSGLFPVANNEINSNIRAFLQETVDAARIIDVASKRWGQRLPMRTSKRYKPTQTDDRPNRSKKVVEDFIALFTALKLEDLRFPYREQRVAKKTLLLEELNRIMARKPWKEPSADTPEGIEITKLLKALQEDIGFFIALAVPDFKGTLHCEACLASFMLPQVQEGKVKDIWKKMEVSYVSNLFVSAFSFLVKGVSIQH